MSNTTQIKVGDKVRFTSGNWVKLENLDGSIGVVKAIHKELTNFSVDLEIDGVVVPVDFNELEIVNSEEFVKIPLSAYNELLRDSRVLNALYRAGVDNWVGYEYAFEDMEDEE